MVFSARSVAERAYSMDEVKSRGYIVVDGAVYDIHRFIPKHRGGKFIAHLLGQDISHSFVNAHGKNDKIPKYLAPFRIGELDPSTREPAAREFDELTRKFRAEGRFEYGRKSLLLDVTRVALTFLVGALFARSVPWLAFLILSAGCIDMTWWVHDAGHDSIFDSDRKAKIALEIMGIVFLGTPQEGYHYIVHRVHHAFPNVLGADPALETGPVIWHPSMLKRSRPALVSWQSFLWLGGVMPITFFFMTLTTVSLSLVKKQYWILPLTMLRWALVIHYVFHGDVLMAFGPVMVAGFVLGVSASLNHFHMPMNSKLEPTFLETVALRTQNISGCGAFLEWLTGGLNFHIEHHLFATMPRRNYRKIAPEIESFFGRHGLPYQACSMGEALGKFGRKLRNPLATPVGGLQFRPQTTSHRRRRSDGVFVETVTEITSAKRRASDAV